MEEVKLDLRERIIGCATKLFFRTGIRRVTMDDIAKECGVSKKTIYQQFKDKDTVVLAVTRAFLDKEEKDLQQIHDEAKDPIDEIVNISKWFRDMLDHINPSLLFDIKKYHPECWKHFNQHKEKCALISLKDNLLEGVKQGLYRDNLDHEILSKFRLESAQLSFNEEAFPTDMFKIAKLQLEIFDHFVYGIVTEKGRKIFETYKNIDN